MHHRAWPRLAIHGQQCVVWHQVAVVHDHARGTVVASMDVSCIEQRAAIERLVVILLNNNNRKSSKSRERATKVTRTIAVRYNYGRDIMRHMPKVMPSAASVRKLATVYDQDGRAYFAVSRSDQQQLSLAHGQPWYWCAKAPRGSPPTVGTRVHNKTIYMIAMGFERTRSVGIVGLR